MTIKMVDISEKPVTHREAYASGRIELKPETIQRIRRGQVEKGDPNQVARLTGIQGAKLSPLLLPLCHPLEIENVEVNLEVKDSCIEVRSKVVSRGRTGVEMEALVSVAAALLNIWDVVKMYEKDEGGQYPLTRISDIRVERKVKKKVEGS